MERINENDEIIFLAGEAYREFLECFLEERGIKYQSPLNKHSIGKQLQWYKNFTLYNDRLKDIDRLYGLIDKLRKGLGIFPKLNALNGSKILPHKGLYIFFEEGEYRMTAPFVERITRIGTHAVSLGSSSSLWNRLRTHRGGVDLRGNHRGSIFRLHVGNSIINKNKMDLDTWGVGQSAKPEIKEKEVYLEKIVSEYIGNNLIDELHADENAHSRIFAQLLRYKENGNYPFLTKFLNDVCGFDLSIENPRVENVDSCGRIDIPIFDKKYVVLIENKVTDKAADQNGENGGQLARYIETLNRSYGRDTNEIYVVYTPKYTREPSDDCWKNRGGFSYKDEFRRRFCSVSYRDFIYPWLKNEVLPTIAEQHIYLRSAVEQYIDHLEGLFSLRTINNKMNMKLQEFIKQELNLKDNDPEEAIEILSEKEQELNSAVSQIQELKSEYRKLMAITQFNEWEAMLRRDFPSFEAEVTFISFAVSLFGIEFNYIAFQ